MCFPFYFYFLLIYYYLPDDMVSLIFRIISNALTASLLVNSGRGESTFFLKEYMNSYDEHMDSNLSIILIIKIYIYIFFFI